MTLKDATQCQPDKQWDTNVTNISIGLTSMRILVTCDFRDWARESGDKDIQAGAAAFVAQYQAFKDMIQAKVRVRP